MKRGRTELMQAIAFVIGLALLRTKWGSITEVVAAIDHGDRLFADFVHHYYPTVEAPLRQAHPAGGFFYPAAFAVLIAPIGWLSADNAFAAWALVQIGCLFWASTRLLQAAAADRPLLAALGTTITVTSIPILHDLKWGQVSLLILVAGAGAFLAYARDRRHLAAVLLGVCAGIKGYPLVFLAWFVLRGDLRFVLRAAIACAVTLVLLPALFMGPSHALFFQRVSTGSVMGAADGVLRDFNSQYAPAVLSRFYAGGWDRAPAEAIAWAKLGSGAALVGIGALSLLAARSSAPGIARARDLFGFVLLACSTPFWLRTSWSHYFVHLPLAQTLLAGAFARRGRARDVLAIGLLVAPSVYLASFLALFDTRGWWYYANAGSLFFANGLVLVGLCAFLVDTHLREGEPLLAPLISRMRAKKSVAL